MKINREYFCVVSGELPAHIQEKLSEIFDDVITLPPDRDIAKPVQSHPDMIFAAIDRFLILSRRYYLKNRAVIEKIARLGGFEVIPTDDYRAQSYPFDVGFNVAVSPSGNFLICKIDAASPILLQYAKLCGYRIIPVKQGYAGCSCIITDEAVLTFDAGIVKTLVSCGVRVLQLDGGGISLPGYSCGFLGGAGGFASGFANRVIYLFGKAETLPCFNNLKSFADSSGYLIASLSNDEVTDYGGIKIFKKIPNLEI